MNRWLQRTLYTCRECAAEYLHDNAYSHVLFLCPARRQPVRPGTPRRSHVPDEPKSPAVA